jgi:hypothetical protein
MTKNSVRSTALRLVNQLIKVAPDPDTREMAVELRIRIRFPMSEILEKVPGGTIAARCREIQCSRAAYYGWLRGETRPRVAEALRLAKITGYEVNEITGRPEG